MPEHTRAAHQAAVEKFIKIAIAATASVTSTLVGSLFGVNGTLIGVGVGSLISGVATEIYGYAAERAKHHFKVPRLRFRGRVFYGVAITAVTAAFAFGVLQVVEASAGKPLHAITTGAKHEYGSSIGGVATTPPAPVPTTPLPSVSYTTLPGSPLPPSGQATTPPPTAAPPTTAAPTTVPASPVPTVTPSGTPVPSPTPTIQTPDGGETPSLPIKGTSQ